MSFPREGKEAELALTTTAGRERNLQINKLLHYSCAFLSMDLIYIRSIFLFEAVSAFKSYFFLLMYISFCFSLKTVQTLVGKGSIVLSVIIDLICLFRL